jgi:hypothetical protein
VISSVQLKLGGSVASATLAVLVSLIRESKSKPLALCLLIMACEHVSQCIHFLFVTLLAVVADVFCFFGTAIFAVPTGFAVAGGVVDGAFCKTVKIARIFRGPLQGVEFFVLDICR